jgi:predicted Zn finger-like uncharacterized protein
MYTRCTHCNAWLRLTARQLREALGQVRCGDCLCVFNALVNLEEQSPPPMRRFRLEPFTRRSSVDGQTPASAMPRLFQFEPQDADAMNDDSSVTEGPAEVGAQSTRLGEQSSAAAEPPQSVELKDALHGASQSALSDAPTGRSISANAEEERGPAESPPDVATSDVPPALQEDVRRLTEWRSPLRHVASTVAATALSLALALQYVWFQPEDLVRRYPRSGPWVVKFCAHTGCNLTGLDNRELIRMVDRTVRIHPTYDGALQIEAQVVNESGQSQSLPDLRFSLFDVTGSVIARRLFTPGQYLLDTELMGTRMRPAQVVSIRLDLIAPDDTAVSFEFEFI